MRYLIFFFTLLFLGCNQADQQQETTTNTTTASVDTTTTSTDTLPPLLPAIPDTFEYTYIDDAILIDWELLSKVDFEETFNEELQAYIPYPNFHPPVLALDGKTVIIKGYIIPLEETEQESILVLSANPFSTCFFCGGAGPETVMDIKLKTNAERDFSTDEKLAFKGRMKLNDEDLYYLNYILEDAEVYKLKK
jgi:hypothetical protein